MERTLGTGDEHPVEAGLPPETASDWTLTDGEFTYEFDEQESRYHVTYDSVQTTPSEAVITVMSTITGIDPMELNPLQERLDVDALDRLFTTDRPSVGRLTFQYSGYEVSVGCNDVVEVVAV